MTQIVSIADLALITADDRGQVSPVGLSVALPTHCRGGAVAIGNFDGVHLGHAVLLKQLRRMANRLGGPAVAVTFDPHPAKLLRPDVAPTPLTTMALRAKRMSSLGIDTLVVCQTTEALLNQSAESFFQALVVDRLAAGGIVEGPNFFFGHDREGDVELLKALAAKHQMQVEIVKPELLDDLSSERSKDPTGEAIGRTMVSSSLIRDRLAAGDVQHAAELCGFPHRIGGRVCEGAQRGRQIGFPTANLDQVDVFLPKAGVYAGWAQIDGHGDQKFKAAIHLGPNPTFDAEQAIKIEVHLLDFRGDIYQHELAVDFVQRIRDVQRFDSSNELVLQLTRDIQAARQILEPIQEVLRGL